MRALNNRSRPLVHERRAPEERRNRAVTILELLVVLLILSILSTIATGVYVGQTQRAKIVVSQDTIREISIAATRYFLDTGQFPLSGSATVDVTNPQNPVVNNRDREGNGLLYLSLVHSLNGNAFIPFPSTWTGPYIEFRASMLQAEIDITTGQATGAIGRTQILDVFGRPYQYVNSTEYALSPFQGALLFETVRPDAAFGVRTQPELPENNPFFATETYYNPITFQIYSFGPNATTLGFNATTGLFVTPVDPNTGIYPGTEFDDINNYGY